ncbi:hypothetical protein [Citrobacter sp.]|uniref:hypothetical protein n=1 Tax=Citrobacter sp. TaxID=1896336 RepID=UPI003A875905
MNNGEGEEKKDILEQGFTQALGGFNELQNAFLVDALDQYSVLIKKSISTDNGVITNQSLDIQQGFAAEAHHTGSNLRQRFREERRAVRCKYGRS